MKQRVFKFRVWNNTREEWVIHEHLEFYGNYFTLWDGYHKEDLDQESVIIQQYTGLKDRNGEEIYENDIDKSGHVIQYNQLHCCYGLFSKNGYVKGILADCYDEKGNPAKEWKCSSIEIIGNIFENPEKLKS